MLYELLSRITILYVIRIIGPESLRLLIEPYGPNTTWITSNYGINMRFIYINLFKSSPLNTNGYSNTTSYTDNRERMFILWPFLNFSYGLSKIISPVKIFFKSTLPFSFFLCSNKARADWLIRS